MHLARRRHTIYFQDSVAFFLLGQLSPHSIRLFMEANHPYDVIPLDNPLSRSTVVNHSHVYAICFGPIYRFAGLAAVPWRHPLCLSYSDWDPIELLTMKNPPTPHGMDKLLFYLGVERSIRNAVEIRETFSEMDQQTRTFFADGRYCVVTGNN